MDQLERALRQQAQELEHIRNIAAPPAVEGIDFSVLHTEAEANYASEFHKRLIEMIANFEQDLDPEHEVGIQLVKFGETVTFHLTGIGYYNPSLIHFYGLIDKGAPVELIQHVTQISLLLMRLPKLAAEARRIGFKDERQSE